MFCNKKRKSSNITSVCERSVLWVCLPELLQLGRVGMGYPKEDSCWSLSDLKPSEIGVFFLEWGGKPSELQPFLLIRGHFKRIPECNLEQGYVAAPTHLSEVITVQWSTLETNTGVKNPCSERPKNPRKVPFGYLSSSRALTTELEELLDYSTQTDICQRRSRAV